MSTERPSPGVYRVLRLIWELGSHHRNELCQWLAKWPEFTPGYTLVSETEREQSIKGLEAIQQQLNDWQERLKAGPTIPTRKKPTEARNRLWAEWEEEGLSHQQIAIRHRDRTGET